MSDGFTKKQQAMIDLIKKKIAEDGYAPTMRELADARGISVKAASDTVSALERKGAVTRESKKARTLKVCDGY